MNFFANDVEVRLHVGGEVRRGRFGRRSAQVINLANVTKNALSPVIATFAEPSQDMGPAIGRVEGVGVHGE